MVSTLKIKRPRLSLANLGIIPSSSFNNQISTFQGNVFYSSYSSDTFIIKLVEYPSRAVAYISVKGELANQLNELRVKEKDKMRLVCRGGKRGKGSEVHPRCTVIYEEEIEGWIKRRGEEGEEHFSFSLPSKLEAHIDKKRKLLAQPLGTRQSSSLPLDDLPSTQSKDISIACPPPRLTALDPDSPTSNSKKRKLDDSANDIHRILASPPPLSKHISLVSTALSASTAPPPILDTPRIVLTKASTTKIPRPPPVHKILTSLPVPSALTSAAKTQTSATVKSEWDVVSSSGNVYTSLQKVKDRKVSGSKDFVVMVVKIGKLSSPRNGIQNDPYCARSLVTDPSLDPNTLDSYLSTVELQWYERNSSKIPTFKPGDVLFVRSLHITQILKLRRYDRTPYSSYLSLPSSSLFSSSTLPPLGTLVFKDSSQKLKLSQSELDHAIRLAEIYRGRMLASGKEGESVEYQLKRLEGQTKPRALEFEQGR